MVRGPLVEGELSPPLALEGCPPAPHSVLASVSRGFPHLLDRLPTCTLTGRHCCLPDPVRLACLIHATSVRSEPESNSQKKNVRLFAGTSRPRPARASLSRVPRPFRRIPSGIFLPVRALGTISSQGSTRAPLGGGERGHSVSNPRAPRKGGPEKKRKKFSAGLLGVQLNLEKPLVALVLQGSNRHRLARNRKCAPRRPCPKSQGSCPEIHL